MLLVLSVDCHKSDKGHLKLLYVYSEINYEKVHNNWNRDK